MDVFLTQLQVNENQHALVEFARIAEELAKLSSSENAERPLLRKLLETFLVSGKGKADNHNKGKGWAKSPSKGKK